MEGEITLSIDPGKRLVHVKGKTGKMIEYCVMFEVRERESIWLSDTNKIKNIQKC